MKESNPENSPLEKKNNEKIAKMEKKINTVGRKGISSLDL